MCFSARVWLSVRHVPIHYFGTVAFCRASFFTILYAVVPVASLHDLRGYAKIDVVLRSCKVCVAAICTLVFLTLWSFHLQIVVWCQPVHYSIGSLASSRTKCCMSFSDVWILVWHLLGQADLDFDSDSWLWAYDVTFPIFRFDTSRKRRKASEL